MALVNAIAGTPRTPFVIGDTVKGCRHIELAYPAT
jgi:hypothetical protein